MRGFLILALLLLVALGIWVDRRVLRPAEERAKAADRLLDESGRAEAAKRRDLPERHDEALRAIPRTESFVWLELRWSKGAEAALRGGEILASFRGNGVVFHRAGIDDATWRRSILDEEGRTAVYRLVSGRTTTAAVGRSFPLTLRLRADAAEDLSFAEGDVAKCLAILAPRAKKWWPTTVTLWLSPEPDAARAAGSTRWPPPPFPAPDGFVPGPTPLGAPNPTRDRILGELLASGFATTGDGRSFRLAAFSVVLP